MVQLWLAFYDVGVPHAHVYYMYPLCAVRTMNYEVRDNAADEQFELATESGTALIAYHREGDVISLDHTEVPQALEGRGIGSALVKGTLSLIRQRGQKMLARCSFVAAYLERHPEYRDLLAS